MVAPQTQHSPNWQSWQGITKDIGAAIPQRIKHWGKLLLRPGYRWQQHEIRRLFKTPRYLPAYTELLGGHLEVVDAASFLYLYDDIFKREIYRFETLKKSPLIIDGGANIGVSIIYFKQLYPASQIIAFEPDPEIFQVCERNCHVFGLRDVELVPKALWSCDTLLEFKRDGSDAGRIARAEDGCDLIRVPACRLRNYLEREVDLLKLDIEGAETEVLLDCAGALSNVQRLFVEYHSFADSPQTLHEIIAILHDAGFRLYIQCPAITPQPFVRRDVYLGMDFQANIFAFRP